MPRTAADDWTVECLAAVRSGASVPEASAAAGVRRHRPYDRRGRDPAFAAAWAAARTSARDGAGKLSIPEIAATLGVANTTARRFLRTGVLSPSATREEAERLAGERREHAEARARARAEQRHARIDERKLEARRQLEELVETGELTIRYAQPDEYERYGIRRGAA
jgi:hypothetical protein